MTRRALLLGLVLGAACLAPRAHAWGGEGEDVSSNKRPPEYGGPAWDEESERDFLSGFDGSTRKKLEEPLGRMRSLVKRLEALKDNYAAGKMDEKEFMKNRGDIFAGMENAMFHEMSPEAHRRFMLRMAPSLESLGQDLRLIHAEHYKHHDPGAHSSHYSGLTKLQGGDARGALRDAEAALRYEPGNAQALALRAGALYQFGDYAGAYKSARQALLSEPGNPEAVSLLKLSKSRLPVGAAPDPTAASDSGGFSFPSGDGALEEPGEGVLASDSSKERSLSLSQTRAAAAALRLRDFAAAARHADRALAADPRNARALSYRAMARLKQDLPGQALEDARKALELSPDDAPLLLTQAMALNKLGEFEKAKAAAERLVEAKPDWAQAWLELARAESGAGRREAALAALRRAAELDPSYAGLNAAAQETLSAQDLARLFSEEGPRPLPKGRPRPGLAAALLASGALAASALWLFLRRRRKPRTSAPKQEGLIGGQYRIRGKLGSGGMGEVYEALDIKLDRPVALKRMRAELKENPREKERFLKEARTVAALRHPNIVSIHAVVEEGPDTYLIFERVEGRTLQQILAEREGAGLTLAQVSPWLSQICSGLDYAHGRGVVHRDLKPSNLMLTGANLLKIMDFGIARRRQENQTTTREPLGTPLYMAPEAEAGEGGPESDLYSLGICVYECLAGRPPFRGLGATLILDKAQKRYAPLGSLKDELKPLDELLAAALEPDPAKRLRGARAFWTRFQKALQANGAHS